MLTDVWAEQVFGGEAKMVSISRRLAVVAVVAGLGGCTDFGIFEGASLMATDKTMLDNAISLLSGKDCSTVRKEAGRTYCVEDEPNPTAAVHCYKTLGDVTCYDRPDPYGDRQQKVGINDHNTTTPR